MEKHENFFRRHWGKMTVIAAASGAAVLTPTAIEFLRDVSHDESMIVTGVPGQVESHFSHTSCASFYRAICTSYDTDYYLGIEQCPADLISVTHNSQPTVSFNPEIGVMSPDCYYDSVSVSLATWQTYVDGSTIVFDGQPGEKLHK